MVAVRCGCFIIIIIISSSSSSSSSSSITTIYYYSLSGTGSCWLEDVDADCCCCLLVIAFSPLKRLYSIASLSSGDSDY